MYRSRLDDIPALRSVPYAMEARLYNQVRLALRRLDHPLRVLLKGLRSLDFILEDEAWAVVDRSLNDVPVLAWMDFARREDLHSPVPCRLYYYHAHADVVLSKALAALEAGLAERLAQGHAGPGRPAEGSPPRGFHR